MKPGDRNTRGFLNLNDIMGIRELGVDTAAVELVQ
jgi:hypothetical protein